MNKELKIEKITKENLHKFELIIVFKDFNNMKKIDIDKKI